MRDAKLFALGSLATCVVFAVVEIVRRRTRRLVSQVANMRRTAALRPSLFNGGGTLP